MKEWHESSRCIAAFAFLSSILLGWPAMARDSARAEKFEHVTAREQQNFENALRSRVLQKAVFVYGLSLEQEDADSSGDSVAVPPAVRWDLSGFYPLPASWFVPLAEGNSCLKTELCKDL